MTDDVPIEATEPAAPAAEPARPEAKKARKPKEVKVEPFLRTYFGGTEVRPSDFIKAVSEVKASRFSEDDIAEAERLRRAGDSDHKRMLGLATQPKLPAQVSNWLWPAVQAAIRARAPNVLEPYNVEADTALRRLHRELANELGSGDTAVRQPATVILQLGLAWMVRQRNLDLGTALQILGDTYAEGEASVTRHVRHALSSGRVADIERAVAISKLMGRSTREAISQRDQEKLQRGEAEELLDQARVYSGDLKRRIAELEAEVAELKGQVSASRSELDDSRQHWGHDMVEVKTRQAALLQEKVVPLLGDAIDALEIDPPQPKIAVRRIRTVLASIKETEG
ncbi:hypothetical protein LPC10_17640 [Methylorubrum sp. B1-46]|uniref:hypothetical protein n=1 Tax=Methylorubrum TaxID=2282523 RepID=UPI001E3E0B18|nr:MULTISPECIES: hypothetical protein [Methylorubrum]MCG5246884.1 hypothetical protein [Methylorubrum extorquens]UGB24754.1 hypothetical protein LPC10_17640 [Methylorubrum sp. B1-46]